MVPIWGSGEFPTVHLPARDTLPLIGLQQVPGRRVLIGVNTTATVQARCNIEGQWYANTKRRSANTLLLHASGVEPYKQSHRFCWVWCVYFSGPDASYLLIKRYRIGYCWILPLPPTRSTSDRYLHPLITDLCSLSTERNSKFKCHYSFSTCVDFFCLSFRCAK